MTKNMRQIPLVVTANQLERTEANNVTTRLTVRHKGFKLQAALRILISEIILIEEPDDLKRVILNELVFKYINFFELGMIKDYEGAQLALEHLVLLVNEGKVKDLDLRDRAVLERSGLLFLNLFELYGTLGGKQMKLVLCYQDRRKLSHPTKHVGVGYNDKGNAKNPSQDGQPSWQELAATLETRVEETIAFATRQIQQKKIREIKILKFFKLKTDCHWNGEILPIKKIFFEDGTEGYQVCNVQYYQKFFTLKLISILNEQLGWTKKRKPGIGPTGEWIFI